MIKISYSITCCDELIEIQRLISFLQQHKRPEDEICVLLDKPKASQELLDQLHRYSSANWIVLKESEFKGHFADWKNELTKMCSGDIIINLDADEIPNLYLIENLPFILENNESDILLVPRINIVQGITEQHLKVWGWKQNEKGWVQWPDMQPRIYRNNGEISWKNKVHEILDGYKCYAYLPEMEEYALYHPKSIQKQEKQNNYYNTL